MGATADCSCFCEEREISDGSCTACDDRLCGTMSSCSCECGDKRGCRQCSGDDLRKFCSGNSRTVKQIVVTATGRSPGGFKLQVGRETTVKIDADAGEEEVERALESL